MLSKLLMNSGYGKRNFRECLPELSEIKVLSKTLQENPSLRWTLFNSWSNKFCTKICPENFIDTFFELLSKKATKKALPESCEKIFVDQEPNRIARQKTTVEKRCPKQCQ